MQQSIDAARTGPETILLVDDDEDSVRVFQAILEFHGYRVLIASNGEECLALARREYPDLIFMDLWMPVLDGLQTTQQLKADPATAHIVVIAISAFVIEDIRERAAEAGCVLFMSKPIEPMEIVAQVRQHLS